jgi:hypothetical protein
VDLEQLMAKVTPRAIGGFLLGLGIVGAVSFGNSFLMKGVGHALARAWEDVGFVAPEAALRRTAGASAELRRIDAICQERARAVELPPEIVLRLRDLPDVRAGEAAILRHGRFVACLATEDPKRLCKREPDRAHLSASVADYYKLTGGVREEWASSSPSRLALLAGGKSRLPAQLPSAGTELEMAAALRGLVASGFVSARDFGLFLGFWLPGDLKQALGDAPQISDTCGSAARM